jgi:hypothetical protein
MLHTAAAALVMEHCTQRYAAAAFVALTVGGSDAHGRSTLNYVSESDWVVSSPKITQQQTRHVRAVAKLIWSWDWMSLCKTASYDIYCRWRGHKLFLFQPIRRYHQIDHGSQPLQLFIAKTTQSRDPNKQQ